VKRPLISHTHALIGRINKKEGTCSSSSKLQQHSIVVEIGQFTLQKLNTNKDILRQIQQKT